MKTKKTIEDFGTDQMAEFSEKQLLSMQAGNVPVYCYQLDEGGYSTFTPLECSADEVQDIYRRKVDFISYRRY